MTSKSFYEQLPIVLARRRIILRRISRIVCSTYVCMYVCVTLENAVISRTRERRSRKPTHTACDERLFIECYQPGIAREPTLVRTLLVLPAACSASLHQPRMHEQYLLHEVIYCVYVCLVYKYASIRAALSLTQIKCIASTMQYRYFRYLVKRLTRREVPLWLIYNRHSIIVG